MRYGLLDDDKPILPSKQKSHWIYWQPVRLSRGNGQVDSIIQWRICTVTNSMNKNMFGLQTTQTTDVISQEGKRNEERRKEPHTHNWENVCLLTQEDDAGRIFSTAKYTDVSKELVREKPWRCTRTFTKEGKNITHRHWNWRLPTENPSPFSLLFLFFKNHFLLLKYKEAL